MIVSAFTDATWPVVVACYGTFFAILLPLWRLARRRHGGPLRPGPSYGGEWSSGSSDGDGGGGGGASDSY